MIRRGDIVTYRWQGRTLLGSVDSMYTVTDEGETVRRLKVRHFNGEPWPVEPTVLGVEVLTPDYVDSRDSDDERRNAQSGATSPTLPLDTHATT